MLAFAEGFKRMKGATKSSPLQAENLFKFLENDKIFKLGKKSKDSLLFNFRNKGQFFEFSRSMLPKTFFRRRRII